MAINVVVGDVVVAANPNATAVPVSARPSGIAETYASFMEHVESSGLAKTVFDAIPSVQQIHVHNQAKLKWPPSYGTTSAPWATPSDPETGQRAIPLIDTDDSSDWTSMINALALGRVSFLSDKAELAIAVATGIKSALESTIKTGKATLVDGEALVTGVTVTSNSVFFVQKGAAPFTLLQVDDVTIGASGSFRIVSANSSDAGLAYWVVLG